MAELEQMTSRRGRTRVVVDRHRGDDLLRLRGHRHERDVAQQLGEHVDRAALWSDDEDSVDIQPAQPGDGQL